MKPTIDSIRLKAKEYDEIGRADFLNRYANGRGEVRHIVLVGGRPYPLKAIWAAAHRPPVGPREFNTKQAFAHLKSLGLKCLNKEEGHLFISNLDKKLANKQYSEGQRYVRELRLIKRHPGVAAEAKRKGNYTCVACNFNFRSRYGEIGLEYIECHHLNPLSDSDGSVSTTINDVVLLCANCHRMVHRKTPPYSVQELMIILQSNNSRETSYNQDTESSSAESA